MKNRLKTVRRAITLGAAVLFVGLGLWLMIRPLVVEDLHAISLNGPMALSEVRAIFGGLMLGIGAAVLLLDLACNRHRDAAMTLATVTAGLVIARIVGVFLDGFPTGTVLTEAIFEGGLLIVLVATGAFARDA